jgi:hypothetical protein
MANLSNNEQHKADDAIPVDSVSLSEAYERIADAVCANPEILPELDEDWVEALKKSDAYEKKIQDPLVFDDELADWSHQRKAANVFLRHCLEQGELVACVRDPETGDVLKLRSDDWLPSKWSDYVPYGIWDDYLDPEDYESAGPSGSFIRGALRPVFFRKSDFEQWVKKTFKTMSDTFLDAPVANFVGLSKDHKLLAAQEAIFDIYGPDLTTGLQGVGAGTRLEAVNKWLTDRGKDPVSDLTVRRALKKLSTPRERS